MELNLPQLPQLSRQLPGGDELRPQDVRGLQPLEDQGLQPPEDQEGLLLQEDQDQVRTD